VSLHKRPPSRRGRAPPRVNRGPTDELRASVYRRRLARAAQLTRRAAREPLRRAKAFPAPGDGCFDSRGAATPDGPKGRIRSTDVNREPDPGDRELSAQALRGGKVWQV
jgi:hypothetical protein